MSFMYSWKTYSSKNFFFIDKVAGKVKTGEGKRARKRKSESWSQRERENQE